MRSARDKKYEHKNVLFDMGHLDDKEFNDVFQKKLDEYSDYQLVSMIQLGNGRYRLVFTKEL